MNKATAHIETLKTNALGMIDGTDRAADVLTRGGVAYFMLYVDSADELPDLHFLAGDRLLCEYANTTSEQDISVIETNDGITLQRNASEQDGRIIGKVVNLQRSF